MFAAVELGMEVFVHGYCAWGVVRTKACHIEIVVWPTDDIKGKADASLIEGKFLSATSVRVKNISELYRLVQDTWQQGNEMLRRKSWVKPLA